MGGKSTTTNTSTSPNPQAMAAYSNLLNQAGQVAATPFSTYGGEFTAPLNAQQQQAGSNINQYAGFAQPYIQQAAGYANQAAQPLTAAQIQQYQSPYTQQVVNATQAQFQNQNQQQLEGVRGNAAAQGALGGDREAVAEGITSGQQSLAQAPVIAGLYNQSYNTALSTAQQQQQNLGQAAYSLGNLGVAGQNAGLTGANAQLGYGTLGQSTSQAQDTALYNQFLAQQAYPFQTTQWEAGIDTGVGSQMGGTSSTTAPGPNLFSSILGLGAAGLGAYAQSDRRVKEGIHKIGKTNDDQPIYRYRYKGSPQWHIGLIAQDVEKKHPEAVAGFGGVKFVNLKAATDDAVERHGGGRIAGFASGGSPLSGAPYSSLGGSGYVPAINITSGSGAPKPPGTPSQSQTDPLKMASEAMNLEKGIAGLGGSSSFGGINYGGSGWGGEGLSGSDLASAASAGVSSGLSFDPLTGSVFARGGSVRGFAGGGLADDLGMEDIGDAPAGSAYPIGSGVDAETERRTAALAGLTRPTDDIPRQGIGLGDLANSYAPGFENNFGFDNQASWNEAMRQSGDRYQAAHQPDSGSLADAASNYANPSSVNGQPQNMTGQIIPPGGFGGGPAEPLPEPRDVADTRPRGLDVSAYAPVPGSAGAPALSQGEEKQSGFGGLGALFQGKNPQLGRALMSAGFAMMASRSPFLGNAIGEGGLAGVASYAGSEKQQASVEEARKKLEQHADEFAKKLALDTKKVQQQEEHFQEQQEAGKVPQGYERVEGGLRALPGGPADPAVMKRNQEIKKPPLPGLSPEQREVQARQIATGNMSPLTGLPRTPEGLAVRNALRNDAAQVIMQEHPGMSPAQVADSMNNAEQQFKSRQIGINSEARTAGNREANLNLILRATEAAVPAAIEASEKVARTGLVPLNRIIQKGEIMTSDPDLVEYGMANLQLAEHWARAMNPTGVMRESDRDKALQFLDTGLSQGTYKRAVMQLQKQITRERDAVRGVNPNAPINPNTATPAPGGGTDTPAGGAAAGNGFTGRTATNPQTGQKLRETSSGQWVQ